MKTLMCAAALAFWASPAAALEVQAEAPVKRGAFMNLGVFGGFVPTQTADRFLGVSLQFAHEWRQLALLTDLSAGMDPEGETTRSWPYLAWTTGLRAFLSRGAWSPYVGAGGGISDISPSHTGGATTYAEAGVQLSRDQSHRVALGAKVELPLYALEGDWRTPVLAGMSFGF